MILVYGGWGLNCSTACSYSWRSNWSNSSIYQQGKRRQQRYQQRVLAICRSSRRSGNVIVVLGKDERTSNRGFSLTKTRTIVISVAVVVSTVILMLLVMSPNTDAAEFMATSSKQQQRRQQLSQMEMNETLLDIPQTLSSQDDGYCPSGSTKEEDCKKKPRIQRPKSRKAESCTIKCVTTCIRGGGGSPGEGPFNVRRPIVVFKEGFHSRQYCLIECSDICNLINEGDSGP